MGKLIERRLTIVKKLGVVGHPISHSKSPEIHSMFAQEAGVEVSYEKYDVPPEEFEKFVNDFFNEGGDGLNITVPFKEQAFKLSNPANNRVNQSKAVNTLYKKNAIGELLGDNTDGPGLLTDLNHNQGFDLNNKRVLVLGAGGAVRGIIPSLIEYRPSRLVIANRSINKAEKLKQEFEESYSIDVESFDSLEGSQFDLIINGTSMGLSGDIPPISHDVISSASCCYDLMYAAQDTAFVSWAKSCGVVNSIDGLGMLVEQAAVSFTIWTGCKPNTKKVISLMRES